MEPIEVADMCDDMQNLGACYMGASEYSDSLRNDGVSSTDNIVGTPEKKLKNRQEIGAYPSTPSNNKESSTNPHQADNASKNNVICLRDAFSNILYYEIPDWIDLTKDISYGTNGMDYTLFLEDSSGNVIFSCYPYYIGVTNPPPYIVDPRIRANIYNRLNNNMALFDAPNQGQEGAALPPYRTTAPPPGFAANINTLQMEAMGFQHGHICNCCCYQQRCKRPSFRFAVPASASPARDLMERREDILEGLAEIKLDEERAEFRELSEKLQKRLERCRKLKGIQSRFESNMREANNVSEPRGQIADLLTIPPESHTHNIDESKYVLSVTTAQIFARDQQKHEPGTITGVFIHS